MNSASRAQLSFKRKVEKHGVILGGLAMALLAVCLLGQGVNAGKQAPGQANQRQKSATPSATITVNSSVDGTPVNNGQCTLREALLNANNNDQSGSTDCTAGSGADTINFNLPAGTQIIHLTSALPFINDSLSIVNSTGPANLTVRRATSEPFTIFLIPASNLTIAITGLTLREGKNGLLPSGGGILSASELTLTNCLITENQAELIGGGIYLVNANGTFNGCTISNNSASQAGGIFFQGDGGHTLTLTNCTVSGNQANGIGYGAGIYAIDLSLNSHSELRLTNCTIADNVSATPNGGGILAKADKGTLTTSLRNTLVANNTLPNLKTLESANGAAVFTSLGHNLSSDDGGGLLTQPSDQLNKNPVLSALGNYGGLTPTHALLPGSPAINAGTTMDAPAMDQRGITRVSAPDIGAFESRGFTLTASNGNNQTAAVGASFPLPLQVTVSSSVNEPIAGGQVTFVAPSSGASTLLTPNLATISTSNRASANAVAINQGGNYLVAATIGTQTVNFNLTNTQCQPISLSPTFFILPVGAAGQPYSQTFTQTGGAGAITWTITAGNLPGNLTLNPNSGVLAGTPTTFGAFNFTVTATDANGCTGSRAYALTLNATCPSIAVNPATLPDGTVGTLYQATISATSGAAPYTLGLSAGTLPSGLIFNASTGVLSGTPNLPNTYNFTLKAIDANGCMGTRAYTVTINNAEVNNGLQFYPLTAPVRLLDTRPGASANACSQPNAPIAGGTSRVQTARNFCGIPVQAQSLTGNITTVQSGGGYLTLYPSSSAQPLVANSNYNPNEILNNVFTVGLGASDGAFKIFVTSNTDVVVDVTGYYAPPDTGGLYFHPLPKPIRMLETRPGQNGCDTPGAAIQAGEAGIRTQTARLTCNGVTIPASARAVVGNATTVEPQAGGYLTLYPAGAAKPLVASSNYNQGQVVNGPFTVGLSASGRFSIFTSATTHLVVDVLGYYSADANDVNGTGLLFNSLSKPVRLLETRAGLSGCYTPGTPLLGGVEQLQSAWGTCNGELIPPAASALVGNATVVNTNGGYMTLWPSSADKPLVASSNFNPGQVLNRHFTVGLGGDGAFKLFSPLTTDLVIDVSGFFAP